MGIHTVPKSTSAISRNGKSENGCNCSFHFTSPSYQVACSLAACHVAVKKLRYRIGDDEPLYFIVIINGSNVFLNGNVCLSGIRFAYDIRDLAGNSSSAIQQFNRWLKRNLKEPEKCLDCYVTELSMVGRGHPERRSLGLKRYDAERNRLLVNSWTGSATDIR